MKEILDTWENMKFSVVKYFKGTQERGYILGSVDEIIQCLDDNTFNLQSISGSRFVGPFLQTVHKWEKTLSLIGEVIEVRPAGGGWWEPGRGAGPPLLVGCSGCFLCWLNGSKGHGMHIPQTPGLGRGCPMHLAAGRPGHGHVVRADLDAGAEEVDVPGEHLHRRGHPLAAAGGGEEVRQHRQSV